MSLKSSLFIFRRDLRFADNTGLLAACRSSSKVFPIFIFDPRQFQVHAYHSQNGIRFMLNSLKDLAAQLEEQGGRLSLFWGDPIEVVTDLIKNQEIEAVFLNRDYTPFSIARDLELQKLCKQHAVIFKSYDDCLLHAPEAVLKSDQTPYVVYSAFYKAALRSHNIEAPSYERTSTLNKTGLAGELAWEDSRLEITPNLNLNPQGGRSEALKRLKRIVELADYKENRDYPALDSTTRLSAHHKFGTLSVREVYQQVTKSLGADHAIIRELYWRDFFTQIGFHFPHVFSGAFHRQYDLLEWEHNSDYWKAWCDGSTGFPLVDAGMRELNSTGFMHNRVRMVVASFLTKDLHISWREGERYFAQHLVDYDPAVNNGNWQWAASTGCDAQPYFRIFNPWLQQLRFDTKAEYIKKWVPELRSLAPKQIHDLEAVSQRTSIGYPAPLVEHDLEREHAIDMYSRVRKLKQS